MSVLNPVDKQVIYLIERLPPKAEAPSRLDKIREIAGTALALIGLTVLVCSAFAIPAHLLGWIAINADALHTLFMAGLVSSLGGFHLAKTAGGNTPSAEFSAGPLSITV